MRDNLERKVSLLLLVDRQTLSIMSGTQGHHRHIPFTRSERLSLLARHQGTLSQGFSRSLDVQRPSRTSPDPARLLAFKVLFGAPSIEVVPGSLSADESSGVQFRWVSSAGHSPKAPSYFITRRAPNAVPGPSPTPVSLADHHPMLTSLQPAESSELRRLLVLTTTRTC